MQQSALAKQLLAMAKADKAMRIQSIKDVSLWDSSLDKKHTNTMKHIVQRFGWPAISLVGKEASNAAWLLVQHADHDTDFQLMCLGLMKALPEDEVLPANIAYLTDRVHIARGEPQLYGTQFWDYGNGLEVRPIKDKAGLDERRRAMGLEPFEVYSAEHRRLYDKRES